MFRLFTVRNNSILNNIIYMTENILGINALMNLVSVIPTVLFSCFPSFFFLKGFLMFAVLEFSVFLYSEADVLILLMLLFCYSCSLHTHPRCVVATLSYFPYFLHYFIFYEFVSFIGASSFFLFWSIAVVIFCSSYFS